MFPAVFLFYLAQTAHGVGQHSDGPAEVAGYVILALFAAGYVRTLPMTFGGPHGNFWSWYAALFVLFLAEVPFAHEDAFVMVTYLAVLSLAIIGRKALPVIGALVVGTMFLPPLIPSWHAGVDFDAGFTTALVALAMYGFFEVVRSNRALSAAQAEVSRLATESERSRIARDLHDLLGHSLTTITVKAGLARRLADIDPARAAVEIGEVEELARRSLADMRTTVAGYREVTLTGELASGRELLRAAGIQADLPGSTDGVRGDLHELFGWVVREGLTNVVRHSRASSCTITLTDDAVEIVDNGNGQVGTATGGHGLSGLRERVMAAHGVVDVGPAEGGGWRLRVEVPDATGTASDPVTRTDTAMATVPRAGPADDSGDVAGDVASDDSSDVAGDADEATGAPRR